MDYYRFCGSIAGIYYQWMVILNMLTFMRDLHRYTARNMGDERMWPLSAPCYIAEGQDIELYSTAL